MLLQFLGLLRSASLQLMPCVLLLTGTPSSAQPCTAHHRSVLQSSCMVCTRVPVVSVAARVPNPVVFSLLRWCMNGHAAHLLRRSVS